MSVKERKERERAERERLIVATARELAEQQGWDAVTTRRLAERIEYSQPVLYSHFRGKREIIGAVALEGATELAAAVRAATSGASSPRERVVALARTYLDFAEHNPAVYDALFRLDGGLAYAQEDTPEQLKDAFAALLACLTEVAGDGVHPEMFTEVFWAALHGLATLTRAGRLLPGDAESRVELLVDRLAEL
ncbi:TetR/AcrR family transcriptional regulator [Streptomyces sp. NPDC012461]|jgi:AcrR family transcriptional regulator|uniref:TetR/AcrR family transcriptional regulator n=2 Tax=unclassified Streptomyces TaxID=2593676 RepID=A0A6G3R3C1_9ACTN|nr:MULTISPECIES: TetR/AcrR family transcriptional regulator [unclassified Streptomyces]MBM7087892.1 TetR/AcrR family transcriptional regulator [Streptomyces sp. S12]NEA90249.1 TetR/AcrR family transcriptional regulator [Streptomyces sp. SID14436]NEC29659.1 TetR/AcrR family transcriptional regulator [Streptomyces sp. SID8111]NEC82432.1 TetR/AcrR family transcriptional regulator [Streptomyces sp. SID7958]NED21873.1 TetR/AcrR family transcriptional regulator [Streptomyces sp. SID9913]